MQKKSLVTMAIVAVTGLAACGDDLGEQGLIGAGAGVATALVLDGNLATGALLGAGANVLYCDSNPRSC